MLGGKDAPACGGAIGVERVAELMKSRTEKEMAVETKKVFLTQLGGLGKRKSLKLFEDLRKANVSVAESLSKDSLKTQMRLADRFEAEFALILGQKEALEGTVIIRDMKNGRQDVVKLEKAVEEVKKRIKK